MMTDTMRTSKRLRHTLEATLVKTGFVEAFGKVTPRDVANLQDARARVVSRGGDPSRVLGKIVLPAR
jgi:hypothetical protein